MRSHFTLNIVKHKRKVMEDKLQKKLALQIMYMYVIKVEEKIVV